ncbi:MAG: hypothetical protein O2930_03115 [Acidobacteria bacterium]|nr:hypothetical protein [Acidobacteriota bacterium]
MACPVCFSSVEPAVRESLNAGIFVLLGITAIVLGCFLRFFVALARRSRASAHLVGETAERPHPVSNHEQRAA